MTPEEYSLKIQKQIIDRFLKEFYEKVGYYPTVITREDIERSKNLLSLQQIEDYFHPYLPDLWGKKLSLAHKSRTRELVELRQIFCQIARVMGFSLKNIGVHLGNRDHTTVIHSLKAFNNLTETDPVYREKYNNIIDKIKQDGHYYNAPTLVGRD